MLPVALVDLLANFRLVSRFDALIWPVRIVRHIPRQNNGEIRLLVAAHELGHKRRAVGRNALRVPNVARIQLLRIVALRQVRREFRHIHILQFIRIIGVLQQLQPSSAGRGRHSETVRGKLCAGQALLHSGSRSVSFC